MSFPQKFLTFLAVVGRTQCNGPSRAWPCCSSASWHGQLLCLSREHAVSTVLHCAEVLVSFYSIRDSKPNTDLNEHSAGVIVSPCPVCIAMSVTNPSDVLEGTSASPNLKKFSVSHVSLYWYIFLLQVTDAKKIQCGIQGSSWIFIWNLVVDLWLGDMNTNCTFLRLQTYFSKIGHLNMPSTQAHFTFLSKLDVKVLLNVVVNCALVPSCSVSAVLVWPSCYLLMCP